METVRNWTDRDLEKLDGIIAEGERQFKGRQPRSRALIGGALGFLRVGRLLAGRSRWRSGDE
jgi:hypothetical protein